MGESPRGHIGLVAPGGTDIAQVEAAEGPFDSHRGLVVAEEVAVAARAEEAEAGQNSCLAADAGLPQRAFVADKHVLVASVPQTATACTAADAAHTQGQLAGVALL